MPGKTGTIRISVAALAAVLTLSCTPVLAQQAGQKFIAIPPALAPKYRFDFARNFFASPAAEKSSRAKVYATLKQLEAL